MPLTFEWYEKKARTNLTKHGVSFEEATTVFGDPLSLTIPDPAHSQTEDRFMILPIKALLDEIQALGVPPSGGSVKAC